MFHRANPEIERSTTSMESRQGNPKDAYQTAPEILSSGFLTPPSPYEGRRDSVASSQSSYCQSFDSSDYSVHTDYSMPVTPTCERSPLAQNGFVDVIPYDLSHDFHGQPMHGLPVFPQPKDLVPTTNVFESFVVVQPPTTVSSASFNQHMFAPSGLYDSALQQQVSEHSIGMAGLSSTEPCWESLSAIAWSGADADRPPRRFLPFDNTPMDDVRALWDPATSPFGQARPLPTETIMPSDAMMDDYVQVPSDGFDDEHTISGAEQYPHTPQEVSFKKEGSPSIKSEPGSGTKSRRMEGRMFVKTTGAKGVKKERRSGSTSQKKSKSARQRQFADMQGAGGLLWKLDDDLDYDKVTGRWFQKSGGSQNAYQCEFFGSDGRQCARAFRRPEHRKRHEKTHTGEQEAWCKICLKGFGRNDNCFAHYETHLRKPGKKEGRNKKFSLREVEEMVCDVKIIEKLRHKFPQLDYESSSC